MAQEETVVMSPVDVESSAPASTGPTAAGNERKRPRLDLNAEPRKKGRSIFGQVFGTLKKARDEDSKLKTSDAVKKRAEIDNRIMGKITRDQTLVRQQDEAKRDRINANRKEEDLAIKNGIMKHRRTNFPRLAGFLLTTDVIPSDYGDDDPSEPDAAPSGTKATLAHPPPLSHPPPLYFLPAILTPAQEKFLAKQKTAASKIVEEETKEWEEERTKGLDEVAQLRAKATETLSKTDEIKAAERQEPSTPAEDKMEVEEDKVGDTPVAESTEPPAPTVQEDQKQLSVIPAEMDAEDTIEY